ncbi:YceI family protein [Flavobacterium undicola]|uniref:YceI family protein n=1 Tax=Flavobacterium undicola TaxID=1932779 RepID=UPI00137756C1|nr:YceI family protein [Flavobacterium undicola]MBA0883197.1 YceI family protein [Flavobacterium undicola]
MRLLFLFTAVFFLGKTIVFSQDKKITKTGQIVFEASVPSFEEVKAVNESVSCILNIKTGEIASLALIKGFRFKVALMEEHFNENYIESSKYPKAIFKGIVKNFNLNSINKNGTKLELNGKLELHGVSKDISIFAIVKKSGEDIELVSDFDLTPADFNIQIPKIIRQKIAETVHVKATFLLK